MVSHKTQSLACKQVCVCVCVCVCVFLGPHIKHSCKLTLDDPETATVPASVRTSACVCMCVPVLEQFSKVHRETANMHISLYRHQETCKSRMCSVITYCCLHVIHFNHDTIVSFTQSWHVTRRWKDRIKIEQQNE